MKMIPVLLKWSLLLLGTVDRFPCCMHLEVNACVSYNPLSTPHSKWLVKQLSMVNLIQSCIFIQTQLIVLIVLSALLVNMLIMQHVFSAAAVHTIHPR